MSNRIDFFQSEHNNLALPAATVSISLDSALCSWLELTEIVRDSWPDFSWARLILNSSACYQGQPRSIEDIALDIAPGKTVCIRQVYNASITAAVVCSLPIFAGQIENVKTSITEAGEKVEIIARDFSAYMERITVYGQRLSKTDNSTLFLIGKDSCFNENQNPNAAVEPIQYNGSIYSCFNPEPSGGKFWTYAEVIKYLLSEYLSPGQLQIPTIEQLRELTSNQLVRDLDVTGMNLIEALHNCCERIGLKFKFVPQNLSNGPDQAIVFYRNGVGRKIELNGQLAGQNLSVSKTDIQTVTSTENFWPVTHRYIGQGDFKVYEATFDLVKAWDPADEDTDYDKFSPSTNPDFYKVKDVYRKWCLNEAGDYSESPYNYGDAFDFSKIFDGENFVRHRRRFLPSLTCDRQKKTLGYFLEVSFDDGVTWRQYLYAFSNLLDECGIWLSSDQLDVETWAAALDDKLKFRITASVISDQRLQSRIADGPVGSVASVIDNIITLPRRFRYRKVSSDSIFYRSTDTSLGQADEVDDSQALFEFVRQKANSSSEIIATIDVQSPYLVFDYRVGDIVTSSPESRDLLNIKTDNRSTSWIKQVKMNFRNQCTDLKIIRQRSRCL